MRLYQNGKTVLLLRTPSQRGKDNSGDGEISAHREGACIQEPRTRPAQQHQPQTHGKDVNRRLSQGQTERPAHAGTAARRRGTALSVKTKMTSSAKDTEEPEPSHTAGAEAESYSRSGRHRFFKITKVRPKVDRAAQQFPSLVHAQEKWKHASASKL